MRDINRIDDFVQVFSELWKKYPDLRFGQLVSVIFDKSPYTPFYVEDPEMLEVIKKILEKGL